MANKLFSKKLPFSKVDDLGFGSTGDQSKERVLNKDGRFNLRRIGEHYHIYHILISMSWPRFFALIFLSFTIINGFFSLIYYFLGVENIAGFASEGFFMDLVNLFHFSVQTMTTVGYGVMHPTGIPSSVVASFESLVGLLSFALVSGLMYGRFKNPKAEIKYSKNILITNVGEKRSIQVRVANKLSHDLLDVEGRMLMLHNEVLEDGSIYKRYRSLTLQIDKISFLPMNWTLTHFIDENSPLYGYTPKEFEEQNVEFLVLITAYDDSFSQLVHSRSSYIYDEIVYEKHWEKPYFSDAKGRRIFDLEKLDKFVEGE
ncbi:MAG: potassium transporter [Chitinophagales bacterium]|nr:potassium transporter [Chitinophagales bacterium]